MTETGVTHACRTPDSPRTAVALHGDGRPSIYSLIWLLDYLYQLRDFRLCGMVAPGRKNNFLTGSLLWLPAKESPATHLATAEVQAPGGTCACQRAGKAQG